MNICSIRGDHKSRRAVAGIVAGLVLFVMLFTVGTGYFLWVNTNNGQYSQALANRGNSIQNQQLENLRLITGTVGSDISLTITNQGGLAVLITEIFVSDSGGKLYCNVPGSPCTPVSPLGFPLGISQGGSTTFDTKVPTAGTPPFIVKIVTQRGSLFAQLYPMPTSNPSKVWLITQLLSPDINPGQSVYDTATLIGATSNAGGTVTYTWYSTSDCTGTGNPPGAPATVMVMNDIVPNSGSQKFNSVGSYSWKAAYSGDANNPSATSPCEPLLVAFPNFASTSGSSSSAPIGYISLNFKSYRVFNVLSCNGGNNFCLSGGTFPPASSNAFSIQVSSTCGSGCLGIAFSVAVTNLNPQKLNITLDQFAQFFQGWNPGSSSFPNAVWYLVNHHLNDSTPSTLLDARYTPILLPFNRTVTLVFSASKPVSPSACTASCNIFAPGSGGGKEPPAGVPILPSQVPQVVFCFLIPHGFLGRSPWVPTYSSTGVPTNTNYGQNLPFVSTLYF